MKSSTVATVAMPMVMVVVATTVAAKQNKEKSSRPNYRAHITIIIEQLVKCLRTKVARGYAPSCRQQYYIYLHRNTPNYSNVLLLLLQFYYIRVCVCSYYIHLHTQRRNDQWHARLQFTVFFLSEYEYARMRPK